ncbi:uncharacterized protein K452DRAFT_310463 [Aplosporella prunicola CBS 121167]|uniref:Uncharacterized protein n=1 Tax=Aplosporella prunicola CBS 121167 TaxID=1176127 RepID=A0A6A6B5U9_9PEZI|nr:uncharacterized protein K452DRAFT_310463 [Aplosporella prunicola CBS 121167]KAF2139502.1 hypothetical protein K452DRAFT_310463 [Aplosporella prunicola CBS 121167]
MSSIVAAAKSSAGSNAFFAIGVGTVGLLTLLLLRYYLPIRRTPAYLLVPVFLALVLPASIILLVPIDLASVKGGDGYDGGGRGIWLPQRALLVCWRIAYWLTFALTWAILPLLGEYSDAGYLSPRSRFFYSLRSNGQYWAIVIAVSIPGAIYFFINSGFHIATMKGLVMALAYAWGLILAIYLMGHGLVAFPRRLWRDANVAARLKRIQAHAPRVHEKLMDANEMLDDYEQQVVQLRAKRNAVPRDFQEWIEELGDGASLLESQPSSLPRTSQPTTIPSVITEKFLAELTRRLKRARHARLRFEDEWARLVANAVFTQAIIDAGPSGRIEATAGASWRSDNFWSRLGRRTLSPGMRFHLHNYVIPALYYGSSAFFALASAAIVWSEVTKSISHKVNIVGLSIVHHPNSNRGKIGFAGQCIAAFWLSYMVLSALYSITEVKIWGNRALVRRNTYSESACWYALQVAKLTVPLAYNFITFLAKDIYQETAFFQFLGKLINLTPLGSGFSRFFPALILLPVAAALFGLYTRVKRVVGLGEYMEIGDEDEDAADDAFAGWREGRALIDRELHGSGLLAGGALGLAPRGGNGNGGGASSPNNNSNNNTLSPAAAGTPSRSGARSPALGAAVVGAGAGAAATAAPAAPAASTVPAWQARAQQQRETRTARALGAGGPAGSAGAGIGSQRRPVVYDAAERDAAEAEGNWLGDFTHRVRNTFDTHTADLPTLTVPRWMRGEFGDEDEGGAGGARRGSDDEGWSFGRLFERGGGGGLRL